MRTKTLILSAAALAAGLLSIQNSDAQVYSANVVGYYNISVPANKKAYIAMQLPGGSGNDSLVNDQLTNGVPDGSTLGLWNGAGFDALTFFAGFGWYDQNSNFATNTVVPGQGALFINGDTANPCTITVVGTVPQGPQTNTVIPFRSFYSMPAPLVTNIDSSLGNFPSSDGDTYAEWDVPSQSFPASKSYTYFAGFGWFDQNSVQVYPSPAVGTSFFYINSGPATNWVFNFTVQ
jgi:hypothetical protein